MKATKVKSRFKKGMKVRILVYCAGVKSEEPSVVLQVDKKGVWLDNGPGNDPSGPYDPITGRREMVLGFQEIRVAK